MLSSKFKMFTLLIVSTFLFTSCGGGGGGNSTDTGTVTMSLMDLPNGLYKAVYVNISEVQVHKAGDTENGGSGSWMLLGSPNKIYNLLELVNGVMESLGSRELPAGKYTQVRLIIGEKIPDEQEKNLNNESHPYPNYVIDQSDAVISLKIPSGFNSGIKLVHPFEVEPNSYTELILDFDAMRSIVETGNKKLTLKPTIKIIEAVNYAEVSGKVTEATKVVTVNGEEALGDIRVSAQTYDTGSEVIFEQAATYTDSEDTPGYYRLIVEPNHSYNIVAFSPDYIPLCALIVADNGMDYTQDFSLDPSDKSEMSLNFTFQNGMPSQPPDVTVNFIYLDADCGDEAVTDEIQVESVVAVYDTGYKYNEIYLPYGNYKLIASAEGYEDFESDFVSVNAPATGPIAIELQELR